MLMHIARWIVNAAALLLVAYLYPGVHVTDFWAAFIAAIVLGLVNAIDPAAARDPHAAGHDPHARTLPLRDQRAACSGSWPRSCSGFTVDGFMAALIGSILYSVITLITSWLLFSKRDSK